MSQRYSDEAMAKKRASNKHRFLAKAKTRYGDRYDYSRMEYIAQKIEVTIGCPNHGWFQMKPDKHLHSKTGCPKCGATLRAKNRIKSSRQHFLDNFKTRHSSRLKLITDYVGAKSPITVKCLKEGHRFETTPDNLNFFFEDGCTVCANEERWQKQMKTPEDFIREVQSKYPDLDFTQTQYRGSDKPISFICTIHGLQKCLVRSFLSSDYGCPACGNEQTGFTEHRIRCLKSGNPLYKPRPTRIALMKMNIWGIETYKLGVTSRTLEARYREALVKVYYETVMNEIDALMLEQLLHMKYQDDRDYRVKKKGMRDGQRWAGDEELYFKRSVKPILADLKTHVLALSEKDPYYWDRYPELQLPREQPRKSKFTKGEYGVARPVICLDNNQIYPSATEAARRIGTNQGALSMVCRGVRGKIKGFQFAYLDDYEKGGIPKFIPDKGNRRQVRCIDTGEVFSSLIEAAKAKGINSSKIIMVCKGKRKTTGGLRWEYVEV